MRKFWKWMVVKVAGQCECSYWHSAIHAKIVRTVHFQLFIFGKYESMLVAQPCPALGNLMDCSPPGSSVHGISQVRILEWVAIPFSRGSSWSRDWTLVSCIAGRFFTIWATREAPMYILLQLKKKKHIQLSEFSSGLGVSLGNSWGQEKSVSISF